MFMLPHICQTQKAWHQTENSRRGLEGLLRSTFLHLLLSLWAPRPQVHVCCFDFGPRPLKSTSAAFTLAPGPSSPGLLLSLWLPGPSSPGLLLSLRPPGPQVHICCFHFGPQALKSTSAAFTLAPGPSSPLLLLSLWPPYHSSPHLLLSLWPPGPQVHVCCCHFGPQALKSTSAAFTLAPGPSSPLLLLSLWPPYHSSPHLLSLWPPGPQVHVCCCHFGPHTTQVHICCFHFGPHFGPRALKSTSAAVTLAPIPLKSTSAAFTLGP